MKEFKWFIIRVKTQLAITAMYKAKIKAAKVESSLIDYFKAHTDIRTREVMVREVVKYMDDNGLESTVKVK